MAYRTGAPVSGSRIGAVRSARELGSVVRTGAVVVLLGMAAAGLRARESIRTDSSQGPLARHPALVPVAVAIVALVAAVALLVLLGLTVGRRPKDDQQRVLPVYGTRWSRLLGLLTALAAIAAVGTLVLLGAGRLTPEAGSVRAPAAVPPSSTPAGTSGAERTGSSHGSWVPVAALAGLAALAASTVALTRGRERERPDRPGEAATGAEPEVLRSVLTAGQHGLTGSVGDPRSGIIECYRAMELAMARAGRAPGRTDTPADVLDRIVALRPDAGPAAERLTTLFREARYSAHPLDESDRADALGALGELRHALGGRP